VENSEDVRTLYSVSKAVLRDEKRDRANAEFKTRANCATPNVISARRTTPNGDSNVGQLQQEI